MSPRGKVKPSPEKRRELLVTAAVAREALVQTHVVRATKLIELSAQRVSAMRMLGIYIRLQDMSKADQDAVSNRVLAQLGQRARKGQQSVVYVEGEEANERAPGSLFRTVRERMKGRRMHDLRRWVELHTGSTQAALLEVHVRHALRFVYDLSETHGIVDALEVYRELVDVPDNLADALYIYVLDRLASEEMPKHVDPVIDPAQVPLFPVQSRRRNKRAG